MKKWRIEFTENYKPSPLSFWVHKHLDSDVWPHATQFEPALPRGIPVKGFPRLIVDALGVELEFASVEEVEHFLILLVKKYAYLNSIKQKTGSDLRPQWPLAK